MKQRKYTQKSNRQSMRLWRIAAAGGLFLSLVLYVTLPSVHRVVSGWIMALTQRSVQSVAGAVLQAGALAPLKSTLLCAFQTFALPWLFPYSIGGNILAFGSYFGGLISLLGAVIGASAWFGLVRLFFGSWRRKPLENQRKLVFREGFTLAAALNWLTPGMLSTAGIALGLTRVKFGGFLLAAAISELPVVILYAVFCNPYRALLPNPIETAIRVLGGFALAGFVIIMIRNYIVRFRYTDEPQKETADD